MGHLHFVTFTFILQKCIMLHSRGWIALHYILVHVKSVAYHSLSASFLIFMCHCTHTWQLMAPPGRFRPLWEILKVSDDKVTHHFHQKGAFGLNGKVSFTRKGHWEPPDVERWESDTESSDLPWLHWCDLRCIHMHWACITRVNATWMQRIFACNGMHSDALRMRMNASNENATGRENAAHHHMRSNAHVCIRCRMRTIQNAPEWTRMHHVSNAPCVNAPYVKCNG
jgi:hypothetical protein